MVTEAKIKGLHQLCVVKIQNESNEILLRKKKKATQLPSYRFFEQVSEFIPVKKQDVDEPSNPPKLLQF